MRSDSQQGLQTFLSCNITFVRGTGVIMTRIYLFCYDKFVNDCSRTPVTPSLHPISVLLPPSTVFRKT